MSGMKCPYCGKEIDVQIRLRANEGEVQKVVEREIRRALTPAERSKAYRLRQKEKESREIQRLL